MANIDFDASDFLNKVGGAVRRVQQNTLKAVNDVATTILALSQVEVPHDIGTLQNSGHVEPASDSNEPVAFVGYNTPYAAYQHEGKRLDGTHVITHWQGGRKGKYLEDPIRHNLEQFRKYFQGLLA